MNANPCSITLITILGPWIMYSKEYLSNRRGNSPHQNEASHIWSVSFTYKMCLLESTTWWRGTAHYAHNLHPICAFWEWGRTVKKKASLSSMGRLRVVSQTCVQSRTRKHTPRQGRDVIKGNAQDSFNNSQPFTLKTGLYHQIIILCRIKSNNAAISLPFNLHCKAIAALFFISYCHPIWDIV